MKKLADIELKNLRGGAQSDQPPVESTPQPVQQEDAPIENKTK